MYTITNRAGSLVSFRGNSGETWHLPPATSIEVMDVEVMENAKIDKLMQLGMIDVQPGPLAAVPAAAPEPSQPGPSPEAER
jgi:hypothetical protein